MNIGILGTGVVGQTLAAALAEKGHTVTIGTRDPAATLARETAKPPARVAYRDWQRANPSVKLATFADAVRSADVVINATSGMGSMSALEDAGADALGERIVIDASNPLDFSKGMPPTLSVCNTDSLGEQLQRAFPRVRLVKALNTITATLMVSPGAVNDGDHTLFLCGNDTDAKATVKRWLDEWFGWHDIVDLGDITAARGMEMYLPIWLRTWGALGSPMFNVKIVR
jgi:predicted dinucleotide-binding enzyme